MNDSKLTQALTLLSEALKAAEKSPAKAITMAALAKAFEITFEYAWKLFKREADQAGLETYSPRDALKTAAQLQLIDDLERWNGFLNARNLSVHDYIGLTGAEYLPLAKALKEEVEKLLRK